MSNNLIIETKTNSNENILLSSQKTPSLLLSTPENIKLTITSEGIKPKGSLDITENGTYDVTNYATANVNVASSGSSEDLVDAILNGTLTEIDSDVTKVISYACYNITTLTKVNLPNVTSINSYAFRGCSGITSFYAPKVTSLDSSVFYGCNKITEVNYQNISQVPGNCFYQCTSLKKADFGVKCTKLSTYSLAYCSKLETLILRYTGGVVSIETNTFSGANFKGTVYVPDDLVESYKVATNWVEYGGSATFKPLSELEG